MCRQAAIVLMKRVVLQLLETFYCFDDGKIKSNFLFKILEKSLSKVLGLESRLCSSSTIDIYFLKRQSRSNLYHRHSVSPIFLIHY